jgi:LytS/YehU family sensor histidine kinase
MHHARPVLMKLCTGAYLVVAVQTIQALRERRNDRVKKVMLVFSISMLCIVCTWFGIASVSNEVNLVERLLNPAVGAVCTPLDIVREILNILIVWAGDELLVRFSVLRDATYG